MSDDTCGSCGEAATKGKTVLALDRKWHKKCWVCTTCKEPFGAEGYYALHNLPYCRPHYKKAKSAAKSSLKRDKRPPSTSEGGGGGGKPFCPGCKQFIKGGYISALGQSWHQEHFVCSTCKEPFDETGFFEFEQMPYCKAHYKAVKSEKRRRSKSSPSSGGTYRAKDDKDKDDQDAAAGAAATAAAAAPSGGDDATVLCRVCQEPVEAGVQPLVKLGADEVLHKRCFNCVACGMSLIGVDFMTKKKQYYCMNDYERKFKPKCASCGERILTEYREACGKAYHEEHFCCAECKKPFGDDKWYAHEGQPYCDAHYQQKFADKCAQCGRGIMGQKVQALNQVFHVGCFVCEVKSHALDPNEPFFVHEGSKYCDRHYEELILPTCSQCGLVIIGHFVTNKDNDYHKECWEAAKDLLSVDDDEPVPAFFPLKRKAAEVQTAVADMVSVKMRVPRGSKKGVVNCSACGEKDVKSKFCGSCGAKVVRKKKKKKKRGGNKNKADRRLSVMSSDDESDPLQYGSPSQQGGSSLPTLSEAGEQSGESDLERIRKENSIDVFEYGGEDSLDRPAAGTTPRRKSTWAESLSADDMTLNQVMDSPHCCVVFSQFLKRNLCLENLTFLQNIRALHACGSRAKTNSSKAELLDTASRIWGTYLGSQATRMINVASDTHNLTRALLRHSLDAKEFDQHVFDKSYKEVFNLTRQDVFARFLSSPDHKALQAKPVSMPVLTMKIRRSFSFSMCRDEEDFARLDRYVEMVLADKIGSSMRFFLKKYKNVVEGRQLVDYFMKKKICTERLQGEVIGEQLREASMLKPVVAGKNTHFTDSKDLFRVRPAERVSKGWPQVTNLLARAGVHYGTILLKGVKRYHRTWAVVSTVTLKLFVYRSNAGKIGHCAINLKGASAVLHVAVTDEAEGSDEVHVIPHTSYLQLDTDTGEYVFLIEDPEQRDAWVVTLQQLLVPISKKEWIEN